MYIWTPEPGLLTSVRDNVSGAWSVTGTVIGDPESGQLDPITQELVPPPDPNEFEVSGLHDTLNFSYSGNTFAISSDRLSSLFPIKLTYLQTRYKDSIATVSSWNDLPDDAEEIIKMETIASSPYIISFDVTASYNGMDEETVGYFIEVIHTFSSNATELKYQIGLRR